MAEGVDSFGHGDRERGRDFEGIKDEIGSEFVGAVGEGFVEGGDDGLFDFGAAETF